MIINQSDIIIDFKVERYCIGISIHVLQNTAVVQMSLNNFKKNDNTVKYGFQLATVDTSCGC